jgi:cation diffusion facilitator family transporter
VRESQMNQPGGIALIGALASVVLKEILYRWTRAIGKRTHSAALLANAWHHRTDALSSIPVALAVVVSMINPAWSYIDHIGALVVTLFILHASWRIMRPALEELSDQGASEQLREKIHETAQRVEHLDTAHAIRTRKMGDNIYVDLHITVDGKMSVSQGHEISTAVREKIQAALPRVVDVVVHLEPSDHTGEEEEQEKNHA